MTRIAITLATVLISATTWAALPALAETPVEKGHRIMKKVNDLPQFEKVRIESELQIYDSQGKRLFTKRLRGATYYKDFANPATRLQRSINYFFAPADDKGNGSLSFEQPNSDDDEQYLYLKQTRKVRRIIGSSKSNDFMGSDFSNGDIIRRRYGDYNFKWLGSDTVEFKGRKIKVEKIESRFKDAQKQKDFGESKSIVWMHPTSGLAFKAERYNLSRQLDKVMSIKGFIKGKNRNGKPVYAPSIIEMKNLNRSTRSAFVITKRIFEENSGVNPSIFTKDSLTKKWW